MENQICRNCKYFRQHYGMDGKRIFRLECGHCMLPRLKTTKSHRKACLEFVQGENKEKEFVVIESRRDAIIAAISQYARQGDTVLLAGKGHEAYEIDSTGRHPFDEREIVKHAFERRDEINSRKGKKNEG